MTGVSAAASPVPPAERRLLTIMFCDLVGSTALSARLDPEDLRDVLAAYQNRATAIVETAGGRVARYEGDGILAYFGYPTANEDDAERAVRAGLELASGIDASGNVGLRLGIRVGIATGVVVVGELSRLGAADNPPVVGETPNLAARLQGLAEPGAVVIDDGTRRLTGGLFEYRDCGPQRMEGFGEAVRAWQVIRQSDVASRFEALRTRTLPLVGRDPEMQILLDRWAEAKTGTGRVVVISGEPGIGKSRIAHELVTRVRAEPGLALRYYCTPYHQNSALHPILEWLRRAAKFDRAETAAAKLDRLRPFLPEGGGPPAAAAAALAELLALPAVSDTQEPQPDARRKRELLFEGILTHFQRMASEQPILVVVEDAHWIDPTSQQLADLLVGMIRQLPVLVVVTCRPEYRRAWQDELHAARLELKPIATRDAEALIKHIAGGGDLPGSVVRGIAERADGVPLFIEELTKTVLDRNAADSAAHKTLAIPSSLHASLMARLDRLGEARDIAKVAAALGRRFDFPVLQAALPDRAETDLKEALQKIIDAELILPIGPSAPASYAFRHALIQDAAYGTLLRSERRALHGRIAKALEDKFPETVATQPEIIASHFTNAELAEPAIRHWLEAGNRAARGWALVEAIKHLSEGIRLAGTLPPSPRRQRLELDLHMALGPVTMGTKGYAAQESLQVFQRAEALVAAVGNVSERMVVLLGLFNVHYGRAELAQAMEVAREHCTLAERQGVGLGRAYGLLAQTYAAMGEFGRAAAEFRRSLEVFARTPEEFSSLGVFGSQHVISLALGGGMHFALGQPELGRAEIAESIARARQLQHALSIALALVTELLTPIPGGVDPDLARAEEAVRFCAEHGLSNFQAWAEFARGAVIARRGNAREGIKVMRAAIDKAEAMNSRLFRPVQLATLASAHARLGEVDDLLQLVSQAIEMAERTGEKRANSALHRLRGEILIGLKKRAEGERELALALEIAKTQQANAEETRTADTIARLTRKPQLRPGGARRPRLLAALRSLFGA